MFMLFLGNNTGTRMKRVERMKMDLFLHFVQKTDYPIYSAKQNKKSVFIRSIRVIRVLNPPTGGDSFSN
jgi:hypothetical protein